jgi:hypothetical protein
VKPLACPWRTSLFWNVKYVKYAWTRLYYHITEEKGCQIVQATLSRRIRGCWSGKGMTIGCGQSCGSQPFVRRLFVLLSFWALLTPAHATIDDAIRSALQTTDPYAKQGYTVHEEDEWGGDLGVNERKAVRHTLLRGTDYWFCVGADLDNARVAIHVYDERGRLAEVDDWQNGSSAAARTLCRVTATYYIVVKVTDSSAERTHWAMVYASKPIGAAKPLSRGGEDTQGEGGIALVFLVR